MLPAGDQDEVELQFQLIMNTIIIVYINATLYL